MDTPDDHPILDRHALVMTIWITFGFAALVLFHRGLASGEAMVILGAFAILAAAFAGHVTLNAVLGRGFSAAELALGLVIYGTALLIFGLVLLLSPEFANRAFLPVSGGFVFLFVVVVFYMVTHYGVRGTFDGFNVIRSFRVRGGGRGVRGASR